MKAPTPQTPHQRGERTPGPSTLNTQPPARQQAAPHTTPRQHRPTNNKQQQPARHTTAAHQPGQVSQHANKQHPFRRVDTRKPPQNSLLPRLRTSLSAMISTPEIQNSMPVVIRGLVGSPRVPTALANRSNNRHTQQQPHTYTQTSNTPDSHSPGTSEPTRQQTTPFSACRHPKTTTKLTSPAVTDQLVSSRRYARGPELVVRGYWCC